jgi:hypothetical protein
MLVCAVPFPTARPHRPPLAAVPLLCDMVGAPRVVCTADCDLVGEWPMSSPLCGDDSSTIATQAGFTLSRPRRPLQRDSPPEAGGRKPSDPHSGPALSHP